MAVDRAAGGDAGMETSGSESPADRSLPPDRPGAEGFPSRADSRLAAIAASAGVNEAGSESIGDPDETTLAEEKGEKVPRPFAGLLDVPIGNDVWTPRDLLERFDPRRAGLPELSEDEARDYIRQNAERRPWLAPAMDCDPVVQRVIAAMDQGRGHA